MFILERVCLLAWLLSSATGQPYKPHAPRTPTTNSYSPSYASTLKDVQQACAALNNVAAVTQTWTHFSRAAYSTATEYADRQRTIVRYVDRVLRSCTDHCLVQCSSTTLARLFKFFFLSTVNIPLSTVNCSVSRNVSDAAVYSAAKSDMNTHVILNFWGGGEHLFDDGYDDKDREEEKEEGVARRRGQEIRGDGAPSTTARTEKFVAVSEGGLANKTTVSLNAPTRNRRQGSQLQSQKKRDPAEKGKILDEMSRAKNASRN
ncbi:unnamed protein product [Schistocephalus solidus]|uniref:Secreted protein n=1 Tax=Schistocephalus solidus TaxID=70667 RepID=A0A183TPQ4_SCHSO|nr:unnamed protein product [Schistocephalus solidus]